MSKILKACECLELLEATSSDLEKESVLKVNAKSKELQYLIKLGIDDTRFHVKPKTLDHYKAGKRTFRDDADLAFDEFKSLAQRLASRKVTGKEAEGQLSSFLSMCASSDLKLLQKWFHRVLCKNLRCGIDTTVQKVWPGLVIPFGVPKGPSLVDQKTNKMLPKMKALVVFDSGPVISQPKCDGIHGVANTETVKFLSSSGKELPILENHAKLLATAIKSVKFPEVFGDYAPLISGECLAKYDRKKDGDRWDSVWGKGGALAKLGNSVNGFDFKRIKPEDKKLFDNDFYFEVYDIYPEIAHIKKIDLEYSVKSVLLKKIIAKAQELAHEFGLRKDSIRLIDMDPCVSWKEIEAAHAKWLSLGYEGSILRVPGMQTLADSRWRGCFLKYKKYGYVDAVILRVLEGKKNTKNEGRSGSFECWLPKKKAITNVTIPTDEAKDLCQKYRLYIPGTYIEAVQQADAGGDVAVSRFPVLSRFRDDLPQMSKAELEALCKKQKIELECKRTEKSEFILREISAAMISKHKKLKSAKP